MALLPPQGAGGNLWLVAVIGEVPGATTSEPNDREHNQIKVANKVANNVAVVCGI